MILNISLNCYLNQCHIDIDPHCVNCKAGKYLYVISNVNLVRYLLKCKLVHSNLIESNFLIIQSTNRCRIKFIISNHSAARPVSNYLNLNEIISILPNLTLSDHLLVDQIIALKYQTVLKCPI